MPFALVAGAGPGVGAAVAQRFGRAGFGVALLARGADGLTRLARELEAEGVSAGWEAADLTDAEQVRAAVARIGARSGGIDLLHYNPSVTTMKTPLELTAAELLRDLEVGVAGLLTVVQAARPYLHEGSRVLATGSVAADRPWSAAASVGVQKAGLRNLVGSLDAELAVEGIRAATLTVRGVIQPGGRFAPELIADALYAVYATPGEGWRADVPFDGRD